MKAPHLVFQQIYRPTLVRSNLREPIATIPSNQRFWLNRLFQWLTANERIEVTKKCDRTGQTYYQIHNRLSGQTKQVFSEEEALAWLDHGRF